MDGLTGNQQGKEKKQQQQMQKQAQQAQMADQYDEMVTKALERLTHWAFPDSQVERLEATLWQLWHTTERGQKYIDVKVTLTFLMDNPQQFKCEGPIKFSCDLNREALDTALRSCISLYQR